MYYPLTKKILKIVTHSATLTIMKGVFLISFILNIFAPIYSFANNDKEHIECTSNYQVTNDGVTYTNEIKVNLWLSGNRADFEQGINGDVFLVSNLKLYRSAQNTPKNMVLYANPQDEVHVMLPMDRRGTFSLLLGKETDVAAPAVDHWEIFDACRVL
jgi:hypothetical protein